MQNSTNSFHDQLRANLKYQLEKEVFNAEWRSGLNKSFDKFIGRELVVLTRAEKEALLPDVLADVFDELVSTLE